MACWDSLSYAVPAPVCDDKGCHWRYWEKVLISKDRASSTLTFCKMSACKTQEIPELHLLPDNPFDLLKKAGNSLVSQITTNHSNIYGVPAISSWKKGGLGGIRVTESDKCFDLPSLTKEKETEYRKPFWKGMRAPGIPPPLSEQQRPEKGW